jgi:hypothetical protein
MRSSVETRLLLPLNNALKQRSLGGDTAAYGVGNGLREARGDIDVSDCPRLFFLHRSTGLAD